MIIALYMQVTKLRFQTYLRLPFIKTNEIPGELSCENMTSPHMEIALLSSHVKRSPLR